MQRCILEVVVLCLCLACSRNDSTRSQQAKRDATGREKVVAQRSRSIAVDPKRAGARPPEIVSVPPPRDTRGSDTEINYLELEKKLFLGGFKQVKSVSSRSWSVRILFTQGGSAIFKPLLKGDHSARFEVAYYRLARLFGVDKVPVSVMRPLYPTRLENALRNESPETAAQFMAAVERDEKGRVWGAMIEWLENIEPLGAEGNNGRMDVNALFTKDQFAALAPALSDMVVLDYVLSNWDRFSGGNLFKLKGRSQLALIDHNEAFYNLSPKQHDKLEKYLHYLHCVRATMVNTIRHATKDQLMSALIVTEWPGELLRRAEMENILMRMKKFLQNVEQKNVSEASNRNVCGPNEVSLDGM